jgi:hypothetical protein
LNHLRHYIKLIRRAEERGCGAERHHIFPRAIFGDNDGVVSLTLREHYIAHKLLFHICLKRYGKHPNTYKMATASNMMGNRTSRYYETTKSYFIENHHTKTTEGRAFISNRMMGNKCGVGHKCVHTEDTKRRISDTKNQKYRVTFTSGEECVIVGMKAFALAHNYNHGHLIQVGKGTRKRHKDIIGVSKLD